MAALDDPQRQADLLTAVGTHGNVKAAAQVIGLSRRAISSYLKRHPELAEAVEVERLRHAKIAHHAPGMMASAGDHAPAQDYDDGELECGTLTPSGKHAFLQLLSRHANDPQSRGCSKAIHVLAELHFAREMLAIRTEAKRAEQVSGAGDQRPIVIRVPDRSQRPSPRAAIDAEVVG